MRERMRKLSARLRESLRRGRRVVRQRWNAVRFRWPGGWSESLRRVWAARPRLRLSLRTRTERNIWYLYVEMFWAAIFLAAYAFNATYALRLGASNAMVGWLSSIPALFAALLTFPSARFLETKRDRAPWIKGSLFVGRLAFLGVALVPWITTRHQAEAVIWILILRTIPMTFFSAGFTPLLAEIIPEQDRARVLANRSIIQGIVVALTTFLFGRWLDAASRLPWAAFPVNYQLVYLVGSVAALLSTWYVGKVAFPAAEPRPRSRLTLRLPRSPSRVRAAATRILRENRPFVRLVISTLVFNTGDWLLMSLYTIFFVKTLSATDGWIGLNATLANVGLIVGYLIWQRVIEHVGYVRALRLAAPLVALYPFLIGLFPRLTLILIWGVFVNLAAPGVNLSHFNILIGLCPPARRASYLALFSSVMNLGAFIAPMAGVALADLIPIRWVFILGGAIRLAGAWMFHRLRPDQEMGR